MMRRLDRKSEYTPPAAQNEQVAQERHYNEDGTYPTNYYDHAPPEELANFVVEKLLPAAWAQRDFQRVLINEMTDIEVLREFAYEGLSESIHAQTFWRAISKLMDHLGNSPLEYLPFDQMVDCVEQAERNYKNFCHQTADLAISGGIDRSAPKVQAAWEEWRREHNELTVAYDSIKRESKFGKLYRPQRPNRWGRVIDPVQEGGQLLFLLPLDTAAQETQP